MKYIMLPDNRERRLAFYLAMEEYVARHIACDDLLFLWQVQPTVIFGRNQVAENEVNFDYCRKHGIDVVRRKSGGGCVYADKDNVMISFITSGDNIQMTYNRFMNMLLLVLRKLGIEAVGSSHNDVMIGNRKVSGTAFYHLPGRCIVHATMLYDTNMEHITQAITPSREKLQAKGIESVRQRITLLKDYTSLTIDQFKAFVRETLCNDTLCLSADDVAEIEKMEQNYMDYSKS